MSPLAHASARVREGAGLIEGAFLQAGDALGRALDGVAGLSARVDAVPAELAGEDMARASESLWKIAAEMSAVWEALPLERKALDAIAGSLDGLGAPLQRLVSSIRTIAILARSARVEAAYLSSNRYNFVEFAEEILALADRAKDSISAYARDYALLTRQLAGARAAQRAFDDERRGDIRASVLELQAAFDAIEQRQHDAVKASARVAERGRRISDVVGDAILGLQAGDSTRQRLEHVIEALDELTAADPQRAAGACALRAAQLRHALDDLDGALRGAGGALAALGRDSQAVVDIGQSLVGPDDQAETLHERLNGKLSAASGLIRECETARGSVDRVMIAVSDTLSAFRGRMDALNAISASITTVGMNAAIKSARLGLEGRALAVISQDLRHYAGQIVHDTQNLATVFDGVMEAAARLERARSGQDAGRMAQADADIAGMLRTLAHNEAALSSTLRFFADQGESLGQDLAAAQAAFADLRDGMAPVRETVRSLAILAREAGPDQAVESPRRYTMESERLIHARFTGR